MIFTNTRRIIKSGFINFWRNAVVSLSSIFVMTVALFFIGSIVLLSVFLQSALDSIRDKVDVNVYMTTEAPEAQILALKKDLEGLAQVQAVEYISREKAIEQFNQRHENDYLMKQALEELGENPLGATLNVKAKSTSQYDSINKYLSDDKTFSGIIFSVNYNKNRIVIDRLTEFTNSVQRIGFAVMIALIVIAIVITFNTIRLAIFVSREEIAIMRLVGAYNSFVRGPFIVEGMMYGVVSAVVATALFYPITSWLKSATGDFYGGIDLFLYYIGNFSQIFGLLLVSGLTLGTISSYLAVRKYLKV
jgi:cell division transport system permease protein